MNSKVAKWMHAKKAIGKTVVDTVLEFKCFMEEYQDFKKESNDPKGALWKKLVSLPTGNELPEDAH